MEDNNSSIANNNKKGDFKMITSHYAKLYKNQTINKDTYSMMGIETDSIKFDTRIGKWSAIDFRSGYFHNECIDC